MKILVTGATGFIGSKFVEEYSRDFSIQTASVRDSNIDPAIFENVDAVVHLSGLAHQMKGAPDEAYFKANFELTRDLARIAKAKGVKHFIYISTAHVFGKQGELGPSVAPLNEATPCHPSEAYGQSKLMAEQTVSKMASDDFLVSIIRPPLVYGEGAKGNIPRLFKLIKKAPVLPLGYDSNKRSMIYVSNLTYFIKCVIKSKATGILLPQDPSPLTARELITLIAGVLNRKVLLINPGQVGIKMLNLLSPQNTRRLFGSLYFDSKITEEKTGYKAPYSTAEGLRRMAELK